MLIRPPNLPVAGRDDNVHLLCKPESTGQGSEDILHAKIFIYGFLGTKLYTISCVAYPQLCSERKRLSYLRGLKLPIDHLRIQDMLPMHGSCLRPSRLCSV
jgi:hypothetical protein